MEEEEHINSDLRGILEEFTKIKDTYLAFEAYHELQEEALTIEKASSLKMKENLEKLTKTYLLLEKRYKSTVEKFQTENKDLRKSLEELKEQCDHLRLINIDRNGNDEEICRLQDETEVLKAQLAMQEEKHNENMAVLKQQHLDEIQRYKVLLQNSKQSSTSSEPKKRGRSKNPGKNKKNNSCFRWPELSVEKINDTPMENEETRNGNSGIKRRKLFYEDRETAVDIV